MKTGLNILLLALIMGIIGCCDTPSGKKLTLWGFISGEGCAGSTNIEPVGPDPWVDPPDPPLQCCAENYFMPISGETDYGRYYWLGLIASDTLLKYGDSVYVGPGQFSGVVLPLSVSYMDNIPEGEYGLVIYASDSPQDVGKIEKRSLAGEAGKVQVPLFDMAVCSTCCSPIKGHAGIDYDTSFITGASAYFEVQYGQKLCGSSLDTTLAYSLVYVTVAKAESSGHNGLIWSQAGFGKHRSPGVSTVQYIQYLEVQGDTSAPSGSDYYGRMLVLSGPYPTGSSQFYKVQWNDSLGVWQGFFPNDTLTSDSIPIWNSTYGEFVELSAEVQNIEDDMFGLQSSPCQVIFASCQRNQGIYNLIDFDSTNSAFVREDPAQWQVDTVGNTLKIWDVNPR